MVSRKGILMAPGGQPLRRWFYLVTAALTCPCHLPIYLLILGGTSVGAALQENLGLAILGITLIFVLALIQGLRAPGGRPAQARDRSVSSGGSNGPDQPS